MENCVKFVSKYEGTKPDEILIKSAAEARSPGSSTVLVGYFDGKVCILILLDMSIILFTISTTAASEMNLMFSSTENSINSFPFLLYRSFM